MEAITFYDPSDGRLLGWVEGDAETIRVNKMLGSYIEGKYKETEHYVLNGVAVRRPSNPTYWEDGYLHDVPVSSVIHINEAQYPCPNGGSVEVEFDQPGQYKVKVESWPHLDQEFTIEN